ncbi:putative FAD-linked oxidoreductase [Fusarium oxysporum f. sp. cubense]|uniref:Putative FAD-linked oxidoreductase n=1 Tax=Fusarium oxysporum f. sp. cubense TaxID=61366 RepID=A0A559LPQ7_FUSOC|nr:putative FAD-linked oxidoreductase [Fusarium oxysporum f. sp. cubense]
MRVLIIGAGVGGLTLAQGLHKAGIEVLVTERQTEKAESLAGYGLHIDRNGRHALRSCLPLSNWTRLQTVLSSAGTQLFFRDTQFRVLAEKDDAKLSGEPALAVERSAVGRLELRDVLLDGLDSASCSLVQWGRTFVRYEQLTDGLLRAHFSDGTWEDCDLLVGADGPKSPVRRQYMPDLDRLDLGIRAIAGRYILDDQRIQKLPKELTSGALNNIVPSGKGWMFTSAWGLGQSSPYIVWAYVVPTKDSAPILDQIPGFELRDHVLHSIKEWSPNLRELVEGGDLSTIKCLPLRTMPQTLEIKQRHASRRRYSQHDTNGWYGSQHGPPGCRGLDALPHRRHGRKARVGQRLSSQNTDPFWALRGAGGRTWGVVTSVTVQAFKDPPIVTFSLSGGAPFGNESYWEAVKHFHALNDAGGNMYYWLLPDLKDDQLGHVSAMIASGGFGNVSSKATIDRLMGPFVKELEAITGLPFNYTSTLSRKASTMYTATNDRPAEVGRWGILGSRIMTRDFLKSARGPGKVTGTLRSMQTYPDETVEG